MAVSHTLPPLLRVVRFVLSTFVYRLTTQGVSNIPATGGVLLVPNHLSYVDAVVLQMACPRPIRFVIYKSIYENRWMNASFRWLQLIPISETQARDAIRIAAEKLTEGEVVCIFPEGELSRSGTLLKLKKGFELIARRAGTPVVPVWLDQLWGSIFSFKGGVFFKKRPSRIPYPVTVAFDVPIPAEKADVTMVRERLLILGEAAYQARKELQGHLGRACIRGLKKNMGATSVIDGTDAPEKKPLSRGMVLAIGLALSRHLTRRYPSKRIAIVLPPGKGAVLANLATVLADKVPVNLNLTAGRASLESALARGDIEVAITAKLVQKRFEQIPWPKEVIYLEELLPKLKPQIIFWRIFAAILPTGFLSWCIDLPRKGDHNEAVLLFTSGSSGEPKGVALSHRNLLANVAQFSSMLDLPQHSTILASLPFFHSFGCTVTLWYPLIEGLRSVTYPSPLETAKNIELIEKHEVTLLCSTPTFLRGYIRKAKPEQLRSLDMVVTGAEKLPGELATAFEAAFQKPVLQGYGLTETSPAVAVNLHDPKPSRPNDSIQPSNRAGSVGKLLPGQAIRITDPETDAPLSLHDTGMLWIKGPNIFSGYLNDPERTAEVLHTDGWFRTGDLARMDDDGFLFIEGRLSRFSKIGGEMVPHETVEGAIVEALQIDSSSDRTLAIGSIPDEAKGEALVLLTTVPIDSADLRKKLSDAGIPNLWVPKIISQVEKIPVLPTGKLDLAGVKELSKAAK
ncbi:MAG TPA: AMP-binding protein [Chthoniobacterales bacterium]|jgi:acyl-[acyl-carrier-protein]-phospholipid O-acyltransferase/long-chain-fatty-acid--[acyl-carrier-protein] ligase